MTETRTYTTESCLVCGRTSEIEIPSTALKKWIGGAFIQEAWPEASPDTRELLLSGTHPECWDQLLLEGEGDGHDLEEDPF